MSRGADRDVMRVVARRLAEEADTLAPQLTDALLQGDPLWTQRGAEAAHVIEDVRLTLEGLADALTSGGLPDTAGRGASRLAAWAAEESIPWPAVAHATSRFNELLLDQALGWVADEEWPDVAAAAAAMRATIAQLSAFGRDIEAEMSDSYHRTSSRLVVRSGANQQRELIDDLLAGRSVRPEDLPFELRSDHLAAIAWGAGRDKTLSRLAALLGSEVTVDTRRDQDWAWFHGTPDLPAGYKQLVREFEPPEGCFIAVGARGSGKDGFATSHRQAVQAARVAAISGDPVTLFGDVALEAFALSDEALARRFVDRQLGEFDDSKPRTAALLTTLEAYFDAGNRATAAASALDVHERTVSYRIRAAEERLGKYLHECQDDLSLALRLRRLFQP